MIAQTPKAVHSYSMVPQTPGNLLATANVKKNISKLTEAVDEGPANTKLGFKYTLIRNVKGSRADSYSAEALVEGGTYILSGHGKTDFFEIRLEGGPQYVRKICIGIPVRDGKDKVWGLSKLDGAMIQLQVKGVWRNYTVVDFTKAHQGKSCQSSGDLTTEIAIGQELENIRIVKGERIQAASSLGIGKLVLL